jgi:hypothetical protein
MKMRKMTRTKKGKEVRVMMKRREKTLRAMLGMGLQQVRTEKKKTKKRRKRKRRRNSQQVGNEQHLVSLLQ